MCECGADSGLGEKRLGSWFELWAPWQLGCLALWPSGTPVGMAWVPWPRQQGDPEDSDGRSGGAQTPQSTSPERCTRRSSRSRSLMNLPAQWGEGARPSSSGHLRRGAEPHAGHVARQFAAAVRPVQQPTVPRNTDTMRPWGKPAAAPDTHAPVPGVAPAACGGPAPPGVQAVLSRPSVRPSPRPYGLLLLLYPTPTPSGWQQGQNKQPAVWRAPAVSPACRRAILQGRTPWLRQWKAEGW